MATDKGYSVGFRITSEFDPTGTNQAKAALTNVTGVSNQAAGATNGLATSAKGLKAQFSQAAKSAGALTYVLGEGKGMAGVSKYLGLAIGGLAMGPLGLLIAGATAAVTIFMGFAERTEKAKQKLADFRAMVDLNRRSIDASGVELLAIKYDNLSKAIDDSAAAQKRLNDASDAKGKANSGQRIAEINLGEQVALNGLKPDDVIGRSKVSLKATQDRRDAEASQAVDIATKAMADKGTALADAKKKNGFSTAKREDVRASMSEFEARIAKVNAEIADVSQGKGVSRVEDIYSNGPNGASYVSGHKTVIDKTAQDARLAELQKQLKGEKDSPGLEADYKRLSEVYATTYDRMEGENAEIEALTGEIESAKTNLETANTLQLQNNEAKTAENLALQKAISAHEQISILSMEGNALQQDLNSAMEAETKAREKMSRALAIGGRQEDIRDRIAAQTPGGFIAGRMGARDAAEDKANQEDRDKKRGERLAKELARNGKLGKNNEEWYNLYKEWKQNKNAGGAGGRVIDAMAKDLSAAVANVAGLGLSVDKVATEIGLMRQDLQNNLKTGGGN